jgi:phospholipid/cholesterol/gamma-HCH transport system substrate-binding protein
MEPRAHHVLIGLFTLIVAAAAVLFGLWLSKSYKDVDLRHYIVVFNEGVRGLSQGSAVQYSGIKIGDITNLSLDPQDPNKVLAHIRIDKNIPIRQDTQARLALTDIAGNAVIELSGGTAGSPPLLSADSHPPVIIATPSPIAKLLANSDNLMANITSLVTSAQAILSPENGQRLDRILDSLAQVTTAMASQRDDVSQALQEATELMHSANGLLKDQGSRTLESTQRALASLERTSATLNTLLRKNQAALAGGIQGLNGVGPALQELRNTLTAIRNITRRLENDPASYLLGRKKMQEFKP